MGHTLIQIQSYLFIIRQPKVSFQFSIFKESSFMVFASTYHYFIQSHILSLQMIQMSLLPLKSDGYISHHESSCSILGWGQAAESVLILSQELIKQALTLKLLHKLTILKLIIAKKCKWVFKGEVSPNNNVDWVSRTQIYKPNSKSLSRFR